MRSRPGACFSSTAGAHGVLGDGLREATRDLRSHLGSPTRSDPPHPVPTLGPLGGVLEVAGELESAGTASWFSQPGSEMMVTGQSCLPPGL